MSSNLTVTEAQAAKRDLEKTLLREIQSFQELTGARVRSVNLDIGASYPRPYEVCAVRVEAEL